jgi:hypothetical protein
MSQYFTPFKIDDTSTTTNAAFYQNLVLSANTVNTSTVISARRILITTGVAPVLVAFGPAPVVSATTGFQVPANSAIIFNFESGCKVAAVATAAAVISILDLD